MFGLFKKKNDDIYSAEQAGKIIEEAYNKAKASFEFKSNLLVAQKQNEYIVKIKIKNSFVFDPILVENYLKSILLPKFYEIEVSVDTVTINRNKKETL
ncbi:MAG: hypothetical protein PHR61_03900 [Candidatus Absconditabacteria bacterium]|nr:hypothetical protein [Candidatus Absconditabacteria bacterium]